MKAKKMTRKKAHLKTEEDLEKMSEQFQNYYLMLPVFGDNPAPELDELVARVLKSKSKTRESWVRERLQDLEADGVFRILSDGSVRTK
jgi:hypothetical protein